MMQIGPVQLLVIGHPTDEPHEGLRQELERLRATPGIRLIDLVHVRKHEDGRLERLDLSDLTPAEAVELGAVVGALIGFGFACSWGWPPPGARPGPALWAP
jgi:uncharacterized membrane protein